MRTKFRTSEGQRVVFRGIKQKESLQKRLNGNASQAHSQTRLISQLDDGVIVLHKFLYHPDGYWEGFVWCILTNGDIQSSLDTHLKFEVSYDNNVLKLFPVGSSFFACLL